MANEKKSDGSVTLLNRGRRHFEIALDEKGRSRRHAPGSTMTYSAADAKRAEGYSDLVDISKLPGTVDANKLKAENSSLQDENAKLKAQLAALEPKKEDKKDEKKDAPKEEAKK